MSDQSISYDNALSAEELLKIEENLAGLKQKMQEALSTINDIGPIGRAQKLADLGLEKYMLELDSQGYTVIPPEVVGPPEMVEKLRDAVLRTCERRTGVPHAMDKPGNPGRLDVDEYAISGDNYFLYYLIKEDPVFCDWLENDVLASIMDYLLDGKGLIASYMTFIRWANPDLPAKDENDLALYLHSDAGGVVSNLIYNSVLCLGPHYKDDGAMMVVPGSHKFQRQPEPGEGIERMIPIECPEGSLFIWNGCTWHAAPKRKNPGIRLNLQCRFHHQVLKTLEEFGEDMPEELLKGRSKRFLQFVGYGQYYVSARKGPTHVSFQDWSIRSSIPVATDFSRSSTQNVRVA